MSHSRVALLYWCAGAGGVRQATWSDRVRHLSWHPAGHGDSLARHRPPRVQRPGVSASWHRRWREGKTNPRPIML